MTDFQIVFQNPRLWIAALAVFGLILFVLSFRGIDSRTGRRDRRILAGLRGAALLLGLLLLLQPELRWQSKKVLSPLFVVAVDNSRSMLEQNGFSSPDLGAELDELERTLQSRGFRTRYFRFGEQAAPLASDRPELDGSDLSTDISAVLRRFQQLDGQNVAAGLLISDGAYNQGENPEYMPVDVDFPIYAAGVGDTSGAADPRVETLNVPDFARVGDSVKITAEITPIGEGDPLEAVLYREDRILDRRQMQSQPQAFQQEVEFRVVPEQSGILHLWVALQAEKDINPYNNQQNAQLRVEKGKRRMLVASRHASPETRLLLTELRAIEDLEVHSVLAHSTGMKSVNSIDELDGHWDAAVLIGIPGLSATDAGRQIIDRLQKEAIPLLFLPGGECDFQRVSAFLGDPDIRVSYLPKQPVERTVQFVAASRDHAVLRDLFIGNDAVNAWETLPPIGWPYQRIEMGSGFTDLIRTATMPAEPVFSVGKIGNHKVAFGFGLDLWRWAFMTRESEQSELYPQLLMSLAFWLTDSLDTQPILLQTDKPIYRLGETARIDLRVFDIEGQAVSDALIDLRAELPGTGVEKMLRVDRSERNYRSDLIVREAGNYRLRAVVKRGENLIGEQTTQFTVTEQSLELQSIRQMDEVLGSIARSSDGNKLNWREIASLADDLEPQPEIEYRAHALRLWRWPGALIFILILLLMEWVYRRWKGYQ